MKKTVAGLLIGLAMWAGGSAVTLAAHGAEPVPLKDKTLVAWVTPANLTQRGGSVLTLDDQDSHFDGIVFGELMPGKWMAGSDFFKRTQKDQANCPAETAAHTRCCRRSTRPCWIFWTAEPRHWVAIWKNATAAATRIRSIVHAATGTALSASNSSKPNGWRHAALNCCPCHIFTLSLRCHTS